MAKTISFLTLRVRLAPLIFVTGLGGMLPPVSASAQSLCAARDQVLGMLASHYGESRRGMGMAGGNQIVEIFTSEETGTWTIIVTNPAGVTCLVASGRHFEAVGALPPGEPL